MIEKREDQAPLREDVRLLGEVLGKTLKEQVGESFYERVEAIRSLSKASRKQKDRQAEKQLHTLIRSLDEEEMLLLARAFGHFLNLANTAENYHVIRSHRNTAEHAPSNQSNEFEELIPALMEKGIDQKTIIQTLTDMEIELVLTAHPTEVKRRTLIQKNERISDLLAMRDRINLTPYEQEELCRNLETLITSIWQTDEIRRARPTPVEEAKWGFAIIEEVLWHAVPRYMQTLDRIAESILGTPLPVECCPIRIASWMGGDRDGNPNVTAEVTREVALLSRWMAADLYFRDVEKLVQRLSMEDCNAALRARVGNVREPYRVYLRDIRNRLKQTREWYKVQLEGQSGPAPAGIYTEASVLLEALNMCYRSLKESRAGLIADQSILPLIRRVVCFGLCLARLDIRQESSRHADLMNTVTEYLGLGSYLEWDEEKRLQFLAEECRNRRPLIPRDLPLDAEQQELMNTLRICADLPRDGLGAYVISMSSRASDVLAVRLLQKEAGFRKPLRVVPLFETLEDLDNSASIMDRLFSIPWYKEDIQGDQEVMIGYSDSGKDAGKLAASWAQYRAQEALLATAEKHGIRLNLFHGRGGSVGRGGGPVEHALLAQAPRTVDGRLRVTEQGEVIWQKYAIPELAVYNLLQYTSAVTEATLAPPPAPRKEWRDLMDTMSVISCDDYRGIVREHDKFVDYFRQVTPEQELGRLHIGSRPAKRKPGGGIEQLRAIPWVFAWTQTRLLLPSWLGTGTALQSAVEDGLEPMLQEMIKDWPFFYFFMDMLDMVLAKADLRVAKYYDDCLATEDLKELGALLREKLRTTIDVADHIVSDLPIKEERQILRASVFVRNPYADPLNLLQGEVLRRIKREEHDDLETLEDALMVTIAGIAAAMKNTG